MKMFKIYKINDRNQREFVDYVDASNAREAADNYASSINSDMKYIAVEVAEKDVPATRERVAKAKEYWNDVPWGARS